MRTTTFELKDVLRRFATVLATVMVGLAFVLAGSAIAAPEEKEIKEIEEKIEKPEKKEDSRGLFNWNLFFDQNRVFNLNEGNRAFNRAFFNPFFFVDPFDILEDAIEEELEEEFEERFDRRDDRRGN
ncbi:MAG: hypothetical protein HYV06_07120 [Deltaproteobacteria bacterium]|nr:hypothetical protein [Deltaproteobacteria bacterium]